MSSEHCALAVPKGRRPLGGKAPGGLMGDCLQRRGGYENPASLQERQVPFQPVLWGPRGLGVPAAGHVLVKAYRMAERTVQEGEGRKPRQSAGWPRAAPTTNPSRCFSSFQDASQPTGNV